VNAALTFVLGLALTGLVPAVVIAGASPVSVFVAPLIGAVAAGVAVELEVGLGGTILPWFVVVALALNAVALGILLRRKSLPTWEGGGWSLVTLGVLLAALAIPLTGLRAHEVGYDAAVTWTTHALLVSAGHRTLVSGLQNPVYAAWANPDYPPLVPAVNALGFSFAGRSVLILGPELTALLNAAAVGVLATGIATVCRPVTRRGHVLSISVAALMCLVGFAVGGNYVLLGNYGVDGNADLLWSAAAVAAVLWGLVLPRSRSALLVAWSCAVVASLSKNEGLVTAVAVLLLIALRYRRPLLPLRTGAGVPSRREIMTSWGQWGAMWICPAVPGLVWAAQVRLLGVQSDFFGTPQGESIALRTSATVKAMAHHQVVLPVALVIATIGCIWFWNSRRTAGLGHPVWLWAAWAAGTLFIFATYVFGDLEIHGWLASSVDRTTIYSKLVLLVDIAVWALVALNQLLHPRFVEPEAWDHRETHAAPPLPQTVAADTRT